MPQLRVTASTLNLRKGPSTDQPVVTQLPQNTVVDRLGTSDDGRWIKIRATLRDGKITAWASAKYLEVIAPIPAPTPPPEVPWLQHARQEIGIKEIPGPQDNPRIQEYQATTSLGSQHDEVAWCSSFVNWCMKQSGTPGTGLANARSWLKWGKKLSEPKPGCVVVFKRGNNPAQGHVAFFLRHRGAVVDVLGGNQSNQVMVAQYPAARIIEYRWPA
jgi:uncharacterized protein (TIGR02594 family)